MDISRPCQPEKLIPLLPWPGFDPSFSGHNDRRAIISEWTRQRLRPLGHRGWLVFHARWIFLTTSLWIPPESLATRVGFWDKWWEIHLRWKTIQNVFSRIRYTSRHVSCAKYTAQSWRSWISCEMDSSHNCSLHGGNSEVHEKAHNITLGYVSEMIDMWVH